MAHEDPYINQDSTYIQAFTFSFLLH